MKLLNTLLLTSSLLWSFSVVTSVAAEETTKQKVEDTGHEVSTDAKKATRKVEDKGCEWIHGKLDCAAKKAKHKMENTKDEIKN